MANNKQLLTVLTQEQMDFINGENLILLSTIDKETDTPVVSAISWVKAVQENTVRFAVSKKSRIVSNVKQNPRVTISIIGLGSVYSIVGTCQILVENMEEIAMPLTKVEVTLNEVYESMFWGAAITQVPQFEKTYDLQKAKALDNQVYASLLK